MSDHGTSGPHGTRANGGLTYADYAALPDDGQRYQLVEGELVMTPSPTRWHQLVIGLIHARLHEFVERHGLGEVLMAPLDVVLDDHNVLQPDVLFVSHQRDAALTDANIQGAPDLCVEARSPGTERLDRLRKLALYARFGVPHYWIVDVRARSIEEYTLGGEVYRVRSVTGFLDEFRPAAPAGFVFRLDQVALPAPPDRTE